eukprot:6207968-Pleurochrysis_carterae.AAC.2
MSPPPKCITITEAESNGWRWAMICWMPIGKRTEVWDQLSLRMRCSMDYNARILSVCSWPLADKWISLCQALPNGWSGKPAVSQGFSWQGSFLLLLTCYRKRYVTYGLPLDLASRLSAFAHSRGSASPRTARGSTSSHNCLLLLKTYAEGPARFVVLA